MTLLALQAGEISTRHVAMAVPTREPHFPMGRRALWQQGPAVTPVTAPLTVSRPPSNTILRFFDLWGSCPHVSLGFSTLLLSSEGSGLSPVLLGSVCVDIWVRLGIPSRCVYEGPTCSPVTSGLSRGL